MINWLRYLLAYVVWVGIQYLFNIYNIPILIDTSELRRKNLSNSGLRILDEFQRTPLSNITNSGQSCITQKSTGKKKIQIYTAHKRSITDIKKKKVQVLIQVFSLQSSYGSVYIVMQYTSIYCNIK